MVSLVTIVKIRFPFSIQAGMSSVLFIYIGDMLRQNKIISILNNKFVIISLLCLWIISVFTGSVSMSHCEYGFGFITVIGAMSASILILKIAEATSLGGGKLGRSTLYILCFHQLSQFHHYIYGNPFETLIGNDFMLLLIEFSIELSIALFCSFFFLKVKGLFI